MESADVARRRSLVIGAGVPVTSTHQVLVAVVGSLKRSGRKPLPAPVPVAAPVPVPAPVR